MPIDDPRLSGGSVNPFFPGRKCAPWQRRQLHQVHEPTGRHFKGHQGRLTQFVWLSLDLARIHPTSVNPRELLDFRWNPKGPVIFPVLNDSLSVQRDLTTKQRQRQGKDQSRGESPKGMKDLQITKLGDDKERRHTQKWRKTEMDRE